MVRRRGALCAVLVGGLALAACGIPTQEQPSTISPSRVPLALASPGGSGTTTTQPNTKSEVQVTIYLLNADNTLAPVHRFVQVPAPLNSIITALLAGPTQADENDGVYTAIPSDVAVLPATPPQGSVVTVNFNDAFGQITGSDAELAVYQVVATVVAAQGKLGTGVLFEIDGAPTSVPVSSGAQVSGPVYLSQVIPSGTTN
ncbi:MAG: GerMN domain-containing protein [Acidimicrobiales bacterium]|jgi:spore germination protein GerM